MCPPAHADIGRVDDAPTAGAVRLGEGANELGANGHWLRADFPRRNMAVLKTLQRLIHASALGGPGSS
eukprot:2055272-Alexandrium_andersonii.AAC.1